MNKLTLNSLLKLCQGWTIFVVRW